MLELRPNCEYCDTDLPPESTSARICTYECTFCAHCVATHLENVCPNCGGGFEARPVRPRQSRRPGMGLDCHPASKQRRALKYPLEQLAEFIGAIRDTPPAQR